MLRYILYFCYLILIFPLYSNDVFLKTFFSNEELKKVEKGEIITRMYLKNNATNENTDQKIIVPKTKYIDEDFSVYEMIVDEKAFIPYHLKDNKSKLNFYNTLTSYSKLKGMKYFSRRIQKKQKLIIDTHKIASPTEKKRLKDIVYTEIKPKITNYFLQEDNKFGKLIYKSDLYNEDDNFISINVCFQPVAKFIFSICKKREYKFITYFIYDKKLKGFYYYSVNLMRIRLKFVLKKNDVLTLHPTTFSNRLRAATVHFANLLGMNWDSKINPWDEKKLNKGLYKNY